MYFCIHRVIYAVPHSVLFSIKMDLIEKLFLISDKVICGVLGFTSPWFFTGQNHCFCSVYCYVLYSVPLVIAYLMNPVNYVSVLRLLKHFELALNALVVFDIYVTAYKHNFVNKHIVSFTEKFFEYEIYLTKSFTPLQSVRSFGNCLKFLIFYVLNWFAVAMLAVSAYQHPGFSSIISLLRRVVSFGVTLQWSVCMYHMDNHLDNVRRLLKSVVQSKVFNVESETRTRNEIKLVERKLIDLESLDRVVKVYRILA